jgi:hypothetical protein
MRPLMYGNTETPWKERKERGRERGREGWRKDGEEGNEGKEDKEETKETFQVSSHPRNTEPRHLCVKCL